MRTATKTLCDCSKEFSSRGAAAVREAITKFRGARDGNVALMFGLSLVPIVFLGGMALDFASAMQKKAILDAAADSAALAAVTPAMMTQSDQAVMTIAQNMFAAQASNIPGLNYEPPTVTVTDSLLTRSVTVTYTASSINKFAGILGMPTWPISSNGSSNGNGTPPQAMNTAAPNINFYLLLDNSPSMDLPATSAGITAMINATKNAPSNGANAGGCAFACHESNPAADNLGNPGGIDNYQLAQNLGVVTRIQNMASATQSLMTTAAATEASNNATYQVAIYTFNGSSIPNAIYPPVLGSPPSANLSAAKTAAANINVLEVCQNNDLVCGTNNNDTDTNFENAMSYINGIMPKPGTGAANNSPQEVLFIVTDGVDDEISSTCSQKTDGTRCQQPFNTAWCTTVKNRGILIAVLYTEYLPLPASGTGSNSWYNSYVAPYQSQIGPNLQNCASSNLFFSVTTDGDITAAMQTLFQTAVTTARLTQ